MALDNSNDKQGIVIDPGGEQLEFKDPENKQIKQEILKVARGRPNLDPPGICDHFQGTGLKVSQAEVNFVLASDGLRGLRLPS